MYMLIKHILKFYWLSGKLKNDVFHYKFISPVFIWTITTKFYWFRSCIPRKHFHLFGVRHKILNTYQTTILYAHPVASFANQVNIIRRWLFHQRFYTQLILLLFCMAFKKYNLRDLLEKYHTQWGWWVRYHLFQYNVNTAYLCLLYFWGHLLK